MPVYGNALEKCSSLDLRANVLVAWTRVSFDLWSIISHVHVHNLHPGAKHPRANLHPVQICTDLCRVHMPIKCVHTHQDLIRNLIQVTHFRKNSLCLNVLDDSNCIISVYVC